MATGISYLQARGAASAVQEFAAPAPRQPRLLDRLRAVLRAQHASRHTEKCNVAWVRRVMLTRLAAYARLPSFIYAALAGC